VSNLRVLIVDDHPAFRRGIREIIDDEADMETVGEAASADDALERIRTLMPDGLDLVLMDIDLPRQNGIAATARILREYPRLPIVILTVSSADQDLFDAIQAGAVGFLSKSLAPDALVRALRDFHAGGPLPIPRGMATRLLGGLRRPLGAGAAPAAEPLARAAALTAREQEVMELLGLGSRDREIAERLTVAESTVKKHVRSILRKLGVRNRTEAAAHARRGGLLRPKDQQATEL
jgi:DNA-binding NarL/FixJ family response regulator